MRATLSLCAILKLEQDPLLDRWGRAGKDSGYDLPENIHVRDWGGFTLPPLQRRD